MKKEKVKEIRSYKIFIGGCLFFFCSLLLQGSTLPFVGVNAWNFNTYALIARNYLNFGYLATYLAPVISVAPLLPVNPEYYLHHPQLLSIFISVFFKVFGESYFTARLPVILASVISAVLLYKIGYLIKGKGYAVFCLAVSVVIPATSVFGRMIGQEAFVLMFVLASCFFFLRFLKTGLTKDAVLAVISVILGSLSDWPMAYFVLAFSLFAYNTNAKKLYLMMLLATIFTSLVFLFYTNLLSTGFTELVTAFLVRSPGELISRPGWHFIWPGTIVLRLIVYMNPLIVFASIVGFILVFKIRHTDSKRLFYLCLSFFLFGLFHVLLYPEGSFGHAYWIYFLVPSVVFAASFFFLKIHKYRILLLGGFILSCIYVLGVVYWKTNEARGNMFRFTLAKVASRYIAPYENVLVNSKSTVAPDLFTYSFMYDVSVFAASAKIDKTVIYTCDMRCEQDKKRELYAMSSADKVEIITPHANGIIVSPQSEGLLDTEVNVYYRETKDSQSAGSRIYAYLKTLLRFPQL